MSARDLMGREYRVTFPVFETPGAALLHARARGFECELVGSVQSADLAVELEQYRVQHESVLTALRALTDWGREHTSPTQPNSLHALLVAAEEAIRKSDTMFVRRMDAGVSLVAGNDADQHEAVGEEIEEQIGRGR